MQGAYVASLAVMFCFLFCRMERARSILRGNAVNDPFHDRSVEEAK